MRSLCLLGLIAWMFSTPAMAQIKPDGSVGTQVTPNVLIRGIVSDSSADLTVRIDGGTLKGANLFHSFSDFNILPLRGVYFSNPDGVINIFTRVTGSNPSNINGKLGVLGTANLFLLNPHGIIFGPNASLDVQGSFLASTATKIHFADGTEFSVTNPQSAPLLTVSVPIGLGFGSLPGAIALQGTGHHLTTANPVYSPYVSSGSNLGLEVLPGKTLALVGGEVDLNGGVLTAPGGRVELGSVGSNASVSLDLNPKGLMLGYAGISNFQNIQLSQRALVDVSGVNAGTIQVQGRQVSLNDGSVLWVQNRGLQPAGDINIYASELLKLDGTTADAQIRSGLVNETIAPGDSGNITVSTRQLTVQNGAFLESKTYSAGTGGNIALNTTKLEVSGFSPIASDLFSLVGSFTFSSGNAGDVKVLAQQLSVLNGGLLGTTTLGSGRSGKLAIDADAVDVSGTTPKFISSIISASSIGAGGNGSDLTLNTRTLSVRANGLVAASSIGRGDAGNVTINASESVEVSGHLPGTTYPSGIASGISVATSEYQRLFGLSATIGNGGNVTINTPTLKVSDEALLSVTNTGIGKAGTLRVNAKSILLDNKGSFAAFTIAGDGGNIIVQAKNLQLRHGSSVTATAGVDGSLGNGGNVTINAGTLAQLENSGITANASEGRGGNIQINTQGLFSSADSKITASSQRGISGAVEISTPDVKQQNNLLQQPSNFISTQQVVATSCLATRNVAQGRFVITGQGGLSETPNGKLELPYSVISVHQLRSHSANQPKKSVSISPGTWKVGDQVSEATQLSATADGKLLLSASPTVKTANPQSLTCP